VAQEPSRPRPQNEQVSAEPVYDRLRPTSNVQNTATDAFAADNVALTAPRTFPSDYPHGTPRIKPCYPAHSRPARFGALLGLEGSAQDSAPPLLHAQHLPERVGQSFTGCGEFPT
jgi:hypothetical protein